MQTAILPLAITMMAGPQILADIIFITSRRGPIKVSLAYLSGILLAISSFITAVFVIARALGLHANAAGQPPAWEHIVEILLVVLLIFLAIKTYRGRKTAKPPKWLGQLQNTKPSGAFKLAFALFWLMPSDFIIMLTIGLHLAASGNVAADALNVLPFVALVLLLAGLPLIAYVTFRGRAERAMPKVRDWMQSHSWLINIIVYVFFIVLIAT